MNKILFIAIAILVMGLSVMAAVVDVDRRYDDYDGLLTSLHVVTRVQNGGSYVDVDSSIVSVFPKDTTIKLNDTANWLLLTGAVWSGYTSPIWTVEYFNYQNVSRDVDSLIMFSGFDINSISRKGKDSEEDTLFIVNGTDTIRQIIYYHPGGVSGGIADSTKVE